MTNNIIISATKDYSDDLIVNLKIGSEEYKELVYILQDYKGAVYVPYNILIELGLDRYGLGDEVFIDNTSYSNITKIQNLTYKLDKINLILEINPHASLMNKQSIDLEALNAKSVASLTDNEKTLVNNDVSGLFLNYDLTVSQESKNKRLGSYQDFNYFSQAGVFNQTFFGKIQNNKNKFYKEKNELIRLDTSFIIDNQDNITRLKIGDSISKPADWSSAARFIGIEYSTDFSIRPNIITYPIFGYGSIADLPSTLDVFASNQAQIYKGNLKAGEFDLANIPLPTGKGEVTVRTQDLSGKIETVVLPYYVSPRLLKPGLKDYSYAIGLQRFGYGMRNRDQYKNIISNLDYSLGISDNFTNSLHFESQKIASLGDTVYYKLLDTIILNASVASNLKSNFRKAQKYSAGFDFDGKRYFINSTVTLGGNNFSDTYLKKAVKKGGIYTQTALGYNKEEFGSLSLNYLTYPVTLYRNKTVKFGTVGFNYDKKLSNNLQFRINAGKNVRGFKNKFIIFSLFLNLDRNTYAQVSAGRNNKNSDQNISISSPVNGNVGYGYYAALGKDKKSNYNVRLTKNSSKINSNISVYKFGNSTLKQINLAGSLARIDKNTYLSQPIFDSFALVHASEVKNIPVYCNNQFIANTDNKGSALVPNLPAYVKSKVSLDEKELPINSDVGEIELHAVPKFKSASIINFDLKQYKTAQLRLVDKNNKFVDYDMKVIIEGLHEDLYTGYDGLVYIKNIKDLKNIRGKACSASKRCYFSLGLNSKDEELMDLGNVICE